MGRKGEIQGIREDTLREGAFKLRHKCCEEEAIMKSWVQCFGRRYGKCKGLEVGISLDVPETTERSGKRGVGHNDREVKAHEVTNHDFKKNSDCSTKEC